MDTRRLEEDGVVVTWDFTRSAPPVAHVTEALFASPRATWSSRTPGTVNRGVIYTAKARIEPCLLCGRLRRRFPGDFYGVLRGIRSDREKP